MTARAEESPANPDGEAAIRDTVPRVPHISYFQAVLEGIAKGRDFDGLRQCLAEASAEVKRQVGGTFVAARLMDQFSLWSPVADAVGELMRLGYVENRALPSRRKNVDAHRDATYMLTGAGQKVVGDLRDNPALFRGELSERLLDLHPYFLGICQNFAAEPLLVAEYSEEDLVGFRGEGRTWINALAEDAADRMRRIMPNASISPEVVAGRVRDGLAKRFPPGTEPSRKEILDAVQDSLAVAALHAKGLKIDAITFDTLMKWASQLFLLNESRYVLDIPGRVVWTTASVERVEGRIMVQRRGLKDWGDAVAAEIPKAYDEIAKGLSSGYGGPAVRYPYLEIYKVRSLVAYRVRVNNPVVDRVISEVAENTRPVNYRVELALGDRRWAATSEAPFRIGTSRKYVMLVKSEGEPS